MTEEAAMTSAASRPLTERQQAVLERIDRRVPIKVIAAELGVSETRINQHIRALKDHFSVDSLNELVEIHRSEFSEDPLSDPAYTKNQVPDGTDRTDSRERVDPGEIVFSDIMPLSDSLAWELPAEPRIVPGVLDGENAVLFRLVAIVGIAFGMLAAVVLTVTAALSLSAAMDGKAYVPVEKDPPAA